MSPLTGQHKKYALVVCDRFVFKGILSYSFCNRFSQGLDFVYTRLRLLREVWAIVDPFEVGQNNCVPKKSDVFGGLS